MGKFNRKRATARAVRLAAVLGLAVTALACAAGLAYADPSFSITGLTSPSHPDSETWYRQTPDFWPASKARFTWDQSNGASGYSFAIDRDPTAPLLDSVEDVAAVNLTRQSYNMSTVTWPGGPVIADFDLDGYADVVATGVGQRGIEVRRGNGDGTFSASPTMLYFSDPLGTTYRSIVGDFNDDERPDIAVTIGSSSPAFQTGFGVYLNQGVGTIAFAPMSFTPVPSGEMNGIAAADFNADGKLDIVVAAQPDSVGVCLGNGDGSFGAPAIRALDGVTQVQDVAAGDLNGDSFPDLVVTDTNNAAVVVLYNNGTGGFPLAQQAHSVGDYPQRVHVADFDGDGWGDIAIGQGSWSEGATILTNNEDGTFTRQAIAAPGGASLSDISVADLNGDDATDLIGTSSGLNYVFLNDGSGTMQEGTLFRVDGAWLLYSYVTTGDLDGDGDTDAVVTGFQPGSSRIEAWINTPAATFADLEDGTWYFHIKPVYMESLGGDTSDLKIRIDTTDPEVWLDGVVDGGAYLCGSGGQMTIGVTDPNMPDASGVAGFMYGDKSGAFSGGSAGEPVTFDLPTEPGIYSFTVMSADNAGNMVDTRFSFTMVGDIAGLTSPTHPDQRSWYTERMADLKWDALSGNQYSYTVDGDPQTEPDLVPDPWMSSSPLAYQGTYAGGLTVGSVATGDFNEDGFDDYVVGRDDESGVVIQINNGDGTFDTDPTYDYSIENPDSGNNTYVHDIAVVDMDGDGHLDLVTANGWDNTIGVMLGYGDGSFADMFFHAPEDDFGVYAIDVADFNGDGALDVLCVGQETNFFSIEYNTGESGFMSVSYPMGDSESWDTESAYSVDFADAADFNGDGAPDVAIGTYANGFFVAMNVDGGLTFSGEMLYNLQDGGNMCESLETGDVNDDGNIDVVVANDNDNVGVFIGAGDGTFELAGGVYSASYCDTVRMGDVDGDGNIDLIAQCGDEEGIILLAGDGTGMFELVAQVPPQDAQLLRAAVGDFNDDDLVDVAAGTGDDDVEIFFGQAAGPNVTVGPLDDGVWYFHLRHLGNGDTDDAIGGATAHYRLNIGEPQKPEVRISTAYPAFTGANFSGFQVNGDADIVDGAFRLTPAEFSKSGSFFTKQRIDLSGTGFSSFFTINMYDGGWLPADGMCFVIQPNSASALSTGKGLGYEGITPSVAIEFDTYENWEEAGDPDANHVGLNINGSVTSDKTADAPGPLAESPWNVWIDYEAATNQLEVRMSSTLVRPESPTLEAIVDVNDIVGAEAFIGMTAATGGAVEVHDVEGFYFENSYVAGGLDTATNDYLGGPAVVDATLSPAATPSGTAATVNVLLKDAVGRPLADWPVSFSSTSTGTFSSTEATTNAEGRAQVSFSPASAVRYSVRAQAKGGFLADAEGSVVHRLAYGYGEGGIVEGTLSQTVAHGADGTRVTAVPHSGYEFTQWSDGSTENPRTDTAVTRNIRAAARFELKTYTLAYTADVGGSIEGSATQTVQEGRAGTRVTAVPDAGYRFTGWSDGSSDNPRIDAEVMADVAVTASFERIVHTLAYAAAPGGSIEGSATQVVDFGADGTEVTAVAGEGYQFVAWSDGLETPVRTDKSVTSDKSVTAFFASAGDPGADEVFHGLFYSAGAGGSIEGTATQIVLHGSAGTTVTAVPHEGYRFVAWSDGLSAPARQETSVTASLALTANFEMTLGAPSAVVFTPQTATATLISWTAAQDATGYRIWVNGRLVATVPAQPTSYLFRGILGPDAIVEVQAIGAGATASDRVAGVYSNTKGAIAGVIRYNTSSPLLTISAKRELTRLAQLIADRGFTSVEVAGHTSANRLKSAAYHKALSLRRAKAARTFLAAELKRLGVTASIRTRGYGASKPVATNLTAKGRAKNRRVEIVVK